MFSFYRMFVILPLLVLTFNHFFVSAQNKTTEVKKTTQLSNKTTESWTLEPGHAKAINYSWDSNFTCGLVNKTKSRIRDGYRAEITEFPWMANMFVVYRTNPNVRPVAIHKCSGVIISDYWILTARYCLDNIDWKTIFKIFFKVGSKYKYEGVTEHEYGAKVYYVDDKIDLAMVRVQTRINRMFTEAEDKYIINKACLPIPNIVNKKREDALISGFGQVDLLKQKQAYVLRKARYIIESAEECQKRYNFNDDSICVTTDKNIICAGDWGAPLVQVDGGRAVLIGITSYHGPNANVCDKGWIRFVRVSKFVDWIKNIIESDKPVNWLGGRPPQGPPPSRKPQLPEQTVSLLTETPETNYETEAPQKSIGFGIVCNRLTHKTISMIISMVLVINIFN